MSLQRVLRTVSPETFEGSRTDGRGAAIRGFGTARREGARGAHSRRRGYRGCPSVVD